MRTLAFLRVNEWNFKGPIFVGDTIRVRSSVLEKEARARGRRGVITWGRHVVNQEGKVVQQGVTVTLVEGRGTRREDAASSAEPAGEATGEAPA